VCGSVNHPHPARAGGEGVTDATLATARSTRDEADQERQKALTSVHAARNALGRHAAAQASHESILGPSASTDPAIFVAQLRQQETDLHAAEAAADRLDRLRTQRVMMIERLQQLRREADAHQDGRTSLTQERATLEARMQGALHTIGEHVADIATLDKKHAEAAGRIATLKQQIEKAQNRFTGLAGEVIRQQTRQDEEAKELKVEGARIAAKRKDLSNGLVNNGFVSTDDVRAALLPEKERQRLSGVVLKWDEMSITLRNTVDERLRIVAGRHAPDLEPLLRAEESGREAFEKGQQQATETLAAVQRLADAIVQLKISADELENIRTEAGHMQELSDAVTGKNDMGITLSSYVLSVFLDEIVTFANHRLRVISHDRYALVRRTESDDRRRRAGLDLDVFDNYTGDQRQVQTLSGGEQFYAALSLALGVADAAQHHTGGVRMDAMFIDEGFGSLDGETLDVAIRALMDLQADGRLVAIISHVEELKSRIPVRLEVVKGRTGSSIRWSDA